MHTVKLDTKRWSNWAGNVKSQPLQVAVPDSLEDVVSIVRDCNRRGRLGSLLYPHRPNGRLPAFA
ncbi:hypothetical protein [Brevibacillus centrosporus]|uniref:hypothetical protein n=1 Tax=Brevibacillus centrosporus TaxID=54910 RepID=UPI0039871C8D